VHTAFKYLESSSEKYLIKVNQVFMVNEKKIKDTDGGMIAIGSKKIILSQNLREGVLTEILKDELTKNKTCVRLNCLRDCKGCNS
jgi:hypothetical protein